VEKTCPNCVLHHKANARCNFKNKQFAKHTNLQANKEPKNETSPKTNTSQVFKTTGKVQKKASLDSRVTRKVASTNARRCRCTGRAVLLSQFTTALSSTTCEGVCWPVAPDDQKKALSMNFPVVNQTVMHGKR